jgi:vitamin B12 transporter
VRRLLLNASVVLMSAVSILCGSYLIAAAQSMEEIQSLRLFYKEDELVVSATRHPKPISRVAENMTVITARDIEAMNAHTVAEALNRVPGIFITSNQDFGAISLISAQGSEPRHILTLLDGIPWNYLGEGSAETNSIPIGIIERIEIVKGPASSAWGSSLGGVINIITKAPGDAKKPTGSIKASFGERNTRDYSAQVSGLAGTVGYYLYAGHQDSDGLRGSREFDSSHLFSKFNIPLAEEVNLGITAGFSNPEGKFGDFSLVDQKTSYDNRSFFVSASLEASLSPELDLSFSAYHTEQKAALRYDTLGLGMYNVPGMYVESAQDLFFKNTSEERTTGARGKLTWRTGSHTAVIGIDAENGRLDQTLKAGPFLQLPPPYFPGVPAITDTKPTVDKWALYANDTIAFDRLSITPGIRYDYNSVVGSFVSPSLGVAYRLKESSTVRASVARGFTQPPLSFSSAGGLFLNPNPSLDNESIWSCQAGVESTAVPYVWLKGTLFYHDLDGEITREAGAAGLPTYNDLYVNKGHVRRKGMELEAETVPFYNISAAAGLGYVHINASESDKKSRNRYTYDIKIKYDDRKSFQAQLSGHYVWWDLDSQYQAEYGDWVWDMNLSKKVLETAQFATTLFLTGHNLFNGDEYTYIESKNPRRWLEAGIKIAF